MRSLGSGTNTQLTTQGSQPGYLVQVTLSDGAILRLCSLDVNFPYGDYVWVSTDIDIQGIAWDGSISGEATLTLGDGDLVFWAYAANGKFRDASVSIWQIYAGAAGEVTSLWSGRIGPGRKLPIAMEFGLAKDSTLKSSPRRRVQTVIPAKYLLPPGKNMPGGWTLDRQS